MQVFFLAVDTALFGQEHVLSCTSRFMFDDKIELFTLFYSVCHASTGEELGHFVYNKLKQYNVPFSKLVSVASDGAKNMIGAVNGMIPHLSRLIRQECHVDQAPFKNIWCLAHRLNLVITDFTRVPYINSVFLFANWFTTKRKAVQYKKWLSEKYPNHHFKKIPKPSETRWSFYKDVLVSLLTQVQIIDEYLHQDQEFPMTVQKMTPLFVSARSSSPFISNTFVIAHFSFAKFLLERIWNLNTKMQEEYATLPVLWEQVSNFKKEMRGYLGEMKNDCFQRFEYIMGLENSQKATFLHVMEMMVLNLDIRFPCPGFSIETGLAKRNTDTTTHTLQPEFYKRMMMKCPFSMEVDLFNFPESFIKTRQINPWFLEQFHEVGDILNEIVKQETTIQEKTSSTKPDGQNDIKGFITLYEVFKVVDRTKFPILWDVVLRVLSYIPTSVSCEQSFSTLKRRMQENMKKENAFMFVQMAKRTKVIEL